jgi:hypothetical protein
MHRMGKLQMYMKLLESLYRIISYHRNLTDWLSRLHSGVYIQASVQSMLLVNLCTRVHSVLQTDLGSHALFPDKSQYQNNCEGGQIAAIMQRSLYSTPKGRPKTLSELA